MRTPESRHLRSWPCVGNRLTETGTAPSTYSISPSSNRISGITGALARTYAYDAAGNTTGYSTVTASYNNAGRLTTLANGGSTETSVYNALGQRIEISGGVNGTVLYAYDEASHLLGEYDGTGALIEETVWLGDLPVATLKPNGSTVAIFYIHSEALNAPRQVTRPSDNTPMWTWNSDPFGTDAANPNPAGAGSFAYNLRFPGQLFDGQAGLHYNYFRDFDPAVGRYLESDLIGLSGGVNTYAYVNSDPADAYDPRGLLSPNQDWGERQPNMHLGEISPQAKKYLCGLLRQTKGQFMAAWTLADKQRMSDRPSSWLNPVWEDAENWLYSAGWPPGMGGWKNDYDVETLDISILLHQLVKYVHPSGHSPPSMSAYLAAMEARNHRLQPPKDVLKWCDDCKK